MGCAASTAHKALPGPKIYPEDQIESPIRPATLTSASTAGPATTVTTVSSTTTTPPSDLELAATAQQNEALRISTADIERQQRVALFRATKNGDVKGVQRALNEGANVNSRGMWDNTPLICACQYGYTEVATILIQSNACDVNAVNEKGCTALHHACIESLSTIVVQLLDKGARSNIAPAKLYNNSIDKNEVLDPLQAAVVAGDISSVKALVASLCGLERTKTTQTTQTTQTTEGDVASDVTPTEKALQLAIARGVPLAVLPLFDVFQSSATLIEAPTLCALLILACESKNEATALSLLNGFQQLKSMGKNEGERAAAVRAAIAATATTATCKAAVANDMAQVLKRLLEGSDAGVVDEETLTLAQKINNSSILALLPAPGANPQ